MRKNAVLGPKRQYAWLFAVTMIASGVGVGVSVGVTVLVGVEVAVSVAVSVGVLELVAVGEGVSVGVAVPVDVCVGVSVSVGSGLLGGAGLAGGVLCDAISVADGVGEGRMATEFVPNFALAPKNARISSMRTPATQKSLFL